MLENTDSDEIAIPLSKIKLLLLLVLALTFVSGGLLFLRDPESFQNSGHYHRPKIEILTIGWACVIFFGAGVIIFIIKLFDSKPGLLIDNNGITINPGSFSTSLIEWDKIEGFQIKSVSRTKLIIIYLKNPEEFINQLSPFKRKLASFSLKAAGSPISISSNALKCNINELCDLLTKKLNETRIHFSKTIKI